MLLWAWGSHAIPAGPAEPGKASPPARAASTFRFMLDADVCLAPEEGSFTPDDFASYTMLVRNMLLSDTGDETILQVVVRPSFASPYSLRLEQPRPTSGGPEKPRPYRLRLVRAKGHPWAEMMKEMRRQQGDVVHLGEAEQQRALPAVGKATETKVVPVTAGLANRLTAIWAGALARTQYVNEITMAPDGSGIGVAKLDGTTFHFWHDDRSGTTHSPEKGTLLGDLVDVVETLTRYADAAHAAQPALLKRLDTALAGLQRRLGRNEACLRPESPHARDD